MTCNETNFNFIKMILKVLNFGNKTCIFLLLQCTEIKKLINIKMKIKKCQVYSIKRCFSFSFRLLSYIHTNTCTNLNKKKLNGGRNKEKECFIFDILLNF